jgi:hypothetical protein
MQTYKELKELAVMCAYNARTSTSSPVAVELWNMAREYQRKAAQLGPMPDIGDPPPTLLRDKPRSLTDPFLSSGLTRRRP